MTRRLVVVVAALLAATACGGSSNGQPGSGSGQTPLALHGAIPDQKSPRPSFTLVDTAGQPYDFAARTRGKVTFLYFGYTHCPDECPTSMADVAAALRRVGPSIAQQVSVVFVTTDPWRDKRPVLRHWLDRFSPTFTGLTGTPVQIAGAETEMNMPISRRVPAKKSYGAGRYSVDHFAAVMVYGSDDRLATLYPSGVTPGDIAADIPLLVKG
ncbi:MAG: hypothetical protein QOF18_300 [Frankiaceae bacterium]|nr:hypothetical protein [Frankiaceae bacterium]